MGCDCDNTTFSPWKIGSDDDKKRVVHIFRNINLESLRVHLSARKVDGGRCNFFAAMFSPVVVLDLYCILYYSLHVKSDTSYNVLDDVMQATRSECANVTSGNLPGPLPWVNTVIFIIIATVTIIIIIIIIITRPKPAYGRQGLAGLWGQDTDEVSTFLVFLTSHFAPAALSSD